MDSTASAAASWSSRRRRTARRGRELTSNTVPVQPQGFCIPFGSEGRNHGVDIRSALASQSKEFFGPIRFALTKSSRRRDTGHACCAEQLSSLIAARPTPDRSPLAMYYWRSILDVIRPRGAPGPLWGHHVGRPARSCSCLASRSAPLMRSDPDPASGTGRPGHHRPPGSAGGAPPSSRRRAPDGAPGP